MVSELAFILILSKSGRFYFDTTTGNKFLSLKLLIYVKIKTTLPEKKSTELRWE